MADLISSGELVNYVSYDFSSIPVARLAAWITGASNTVIEWCGRTFAGAATVTDERSYSVLDRDGYLRVEFEVKPVSSVTTCYLVYSDETRTALSLDAKTLFQIPGYMLLPFLVDQYAAAVCRTAVVTAENRGDLYVTDSTYVAGMATPEEVKEAVALLVMERAMRDAARVAAGDPGAGDVRAYSIGSYSESRGGSPAEAGLTGRLGLGTALGLDAERLLQFYRIGGVMSLTPAA